MSVCSYKGVYVGVYESVSICVFVYVSMCSLQYYLINVFFISFCIQYILI